MQRSDSPGDFYTFTNTHSRSAAAGFVLPNQIFKNWMEAPTEDK